MNRRISAIAAILLCLLAVQVGATGAASGTSGARSSGAFQQGKVRIDLEGWHHGPQVAAGGEGRFVLTGAIADRGTFSHRFLDDYPPMSPYVLTLSGAKGTIRIAGDGFCCGPGRPWRIKGGTKAYAGLHGRGGSPRGLYDHGEIDVTMTGTVWK
jgi:hypothetical protein